MNIYAASITGFFTIFFSIIGFFWWLDRERRELYNRLQGINAVTDNKNAYKEGTDREREFNIKKLLSKSGKIFARQGMTKKLEAQLIKADIPLRGEEYLMIRLLVVIIPGSITALLTGNGFLVLIISIFGFILPQILVNIAQHKRLRRFNHQLVDSLSIMSNSLRAGYSFIQAMELVSREMPDPIGKEYARSFREMNLGTPTEEALYNLGSRINSDDLDLIITAVLIQRQIGGNLAEILDNISHTIRERIRIEGEIKTLTAQGRLSGLIIGLIPPALLVLIFIVNSAYMMPLFESPIGWAMLGGGAISQIIGLVLIKKIITIDI